MDDILWVFGCSLKSDVEIISAIDLLASIEHMPCSYRSVDDATTEVKLRCWHDDGLIYVGYDTDSTEWFIDFHSDFTYFDLGGKPLYELPTTELIDSINSLTQAQFNTMLALGWVPFDIQNKTPHVIDKSR